MSNGRSHDVIHALAMTIEMWRQSGDVPDHIVSFGLSAVNMATGLQARLEEIAANKNLSGAGILAEKRKDAEAFTLDLEAWAAPAFRTLQNERDNIRAAMERAIAPVFGETDPDKRAAAAGIRSEYRAVADLMDDNDVMLFYINGDRTIRAALDERLRASKGKDGGVYVRPYVTAEVRESTLVESARAASPGSAKALKENGEKLERVTFVVESLRTLVRSLVPSATVAEPIVPRVGAMDGIRVLGD